MQNDSTHAQDELLRGLTHRMNNILSLFHGHVGLMLAQDGLNKSTRDGLQKIQSGAGAATELLNRTQTLVRPAALVWREVDLAEFLPLLKPSWNNLREGKTELRLEIADELPPVRTDLSRLKTALLELVRNACEAVLGQGVIRIEAGRRPDSQRHLAISVIDDGPGIAANVEKRMFQPFFSTKQRRNAAGLGLAVAAECVRQIEGTLRHESAAGRTCFQIVLPVCG